MPASSDTQLQKLVDLARSGNGTANELLINHACDRLLLLRDDDEERDCEESRRRA